MTRKCKVCGDIALKMYQARRRKKARKRKPEADWKNAHITLLKRLYPVSWKNEIFKLELQAIAHKKGLK